jgi:DNA-binding CsgD family transcriptional regulator
VGEVLEQPAGAVYKVASNWNSLHFEYSSPLYAAQNSVQYSYFLKGFDKDWSGWSKKTEKEYTNLPAGPYTFQVRSKSNRGNESVISSYSFTVLPPWYQTGWAYFIYALLFFAGIYLLYRWQRKVFLQQEKKHEEEQKRLQYLHQLELEKSEKEIVKLKNEKLEAEIDHKNTELASAAMHLVQKGELLGNIREELVRMKKGGNGNGSPEEFSKMLRILGEENKMDKDWEQFAVHFDKVHSDFLRILKTIYPGLSAHELKLCAYLRMNLSSKEIAQLENISVRGVEISRYRLRKKLKIPTETNLFDFLMELHASGT